MKKVKWLKINCNLSINEITKLLVQNSFDENKNDGYIFNKIRDDLIEGQFIEKYFVLDKYYNFLNNYEEVQKIEYKTTKFTICLEKILILTIFNPPRSIKPFLLSLVKQLGIGTSVEEIHINPVTWAEDAFSSISMEITQIDISNVMLNRFTSAKMYITGNQDLRPHYHSSLSQNSITDRVSLTVMSLNLKGKIKLFKTGMAHIDTNKNDIFVNMLRTSLLN